MLFSAILVFTPFMISITPIGDGKVVPTMEYQRVLALANVEILGGKTLNTAYDPDTGELALELKGTLLASLSVDLGLGAVDQQTFIYQFPEELKPILENPNFRQYARIDFEASWLLGSTRDTITGSSLTPDAKNGIVTGVRNTSIEISLLPIITATLRVNLKQLGVSQLPPSPDGKLEFRGIAMTDSLLDLSILVDKGASAVIDTNVTVLNFTVPSVIPFQNIPLKFQEVTINREIPDWKIIVTDNRGPGSQWKITAKATGPFTSSDGHTLDPNALVYVKDGNVTPLIDGAVIWNGTTGANQETTLQWSENGGVLIKMTPQDLLDVDPNVQYTADIIWTLEDTP